MSLSWLGRDNRGIPLLPPGWVFCQEADSEQATGSDLVAWYNAKEYKRVLLASYTPVHFIKEQKVKCCY